VSLTQGLVLGVLVALAIAQLLESTAGTRAFLLEGF
jgi:hypothetical protein